MVEKYSKIRNWLNYFKKINSAKNKIKHICYKIKSAKFKPKSACVQNEVQTLYRLIFISSSIK